MEQITLSAGNGNYPVGEHVRTYFQVCYEIATIINKKFPGKSITLWCRGSSGAIISALTAQHILADVEICHIKKSGESAHISTPTNQYDINIIIDDLMVSGDTVEAIYHKMKKEGAFPHAIIMTGDLRPKTLKKLFGTSFENIKLLIGGYYYVNR